MKKVASIEFLRGVAVSMVMFSHIYAVQDRYFGENIMPTFFNRGYWGVDIFFVISGVVMFKSVGARKGAAGAWAFLSARVTRIYPAYWVITLVIFAIAQVKPELVNSSYAGTPSLLRSLLLFPDYTYPWLNVGWSLVYEMWFYILLFVLLLLGKRAIVPVLVLYGVGLVLVGGKQQGLPVIDLVAAPLVLEFLLGYALGALYFRLNETRGRIALTGVGLGALLVRPLFELGYFDLGRPLLNHFVTFGLPAVSLVAFALVLEVFFGRFRIFKPMIMIGTASYSIYLTHVLLLNAFFVIVLRMAGLSLPVIIANVACVLFVLMGGFLYYRLIERPGSVMAGQYVKRWILKPAIAEK